MSLLEKLQGLYLEGRVSEIKEIVLSLSEDEKSPEIEMILAWAYFHLGDDESLEIAKRLYQQGNEDAFEFMVQYAAYKSKDDKLIKEIQEKDPNDPSVFNALSIRARDVDSNIPIELVDAAALYFVNDERIGAVNLLNNAGRLHFAKGGKKGIVTAIGYWHVAIVKYGDKNYHHRAAVYFWLSKAYEALDAKDIALKMANESIALWRLQVALDPENAQYREKLEGARKRIQELEE